MDPENPLTKRRPGRPAGPAPTATVPEIADALRVPEKTVYRWLGETCTDGKPLLPHKKLGNRVRCLVSDVDKLPERMQRRSAGARRPLCFFSAGSDSQEVNTNAGGSAL